MFLLKKLHHLKRFPLPYQLRLLLFQCRKTLHLNYSTTDYYLNSFLTTHLLRHNAFLLNEDENSYTAAFCYEKDKQYTMTLRKPPSSDFDVYDQVFVLKEYQPLADLVKRNRSGKRSLNIIDAGGNIGVTSIFLNTVFPGSRFGIVEPDIDNYKMLERNIKQNRFRECRLVNGGVWDKDTYLKINRNFRDGNDWSVSVTESEDATALKGVSILTLMKLLNFDVIDILKIDIEGSEKQLFSDCSVATMFLSKTKFIAIEIHDEFDCRDKINDCLLKNNFDFFLVDGLTIGMNRNLVDHLNS